jgi:hypothetical protein
MWATNGEVLDTETFCSLSKGLDPHKNSVLLAKSLQLVCAYSSKEVYEREQTQTFL